MNHVPFLHVTVTAKKNGEVANIFDHFYSLFGASPPAPPPLLTILAVNVGSPPQRDARRAHRVGNVRHQNYLQGGGAGGRLQNFLVAGVSFDSEGFLGFSSQN